ncbi:MAG: zinc dependent phospholipase C family protein [Clostridia bacterium]|nr:zinc dependent phospholipase C family protein [Clostridia bacterium]
MLSATHKLIAKRVYEALKNELNVCVDLKSLCYGSIAPDIYPSMMILPHSKEGSLEFLHKNIEWLMEQPIPENKRDMKNFSFRLGIIVHFISDYFCSAHNEAKYNNLINHFIYERALKKVFARRMEKHSVKPPYAWWSMGDIKGFIESNHREYTSAKKSMYGDMVHSLNNSIIVSLKIVSGCMERHTSDIFIKQLDTRYRTA